MILKDKAGTVCLDCNPETRDLFVDRCDKTNKNQKWEWGFVNQTMMNDWEKSGAKIL
jgi:inorganic pyrophosphatase